MGIHGVSGPGGGPPRLPPKRRQEAEDVESGSSNNLGGHNVIEVNQGEEESTSGLSFGETRERLSKLQMRTPEDQDQRTSSSSGPNVFTRIWKSVKNFFTFERVAAPTISSPIPPGYVRHGVRLSGIDEIRSHLEEHPRNISSQSGFSLSELETRTKNFNELLDPNKGESLPPSQQVLVREWLKKTDKDLQLTEHSDNSSQSLEELRDAITSDPQDVNDNALEELILDGEKASDQLSAFRGPDHDRDDVLYAQLNLQSTSEVHPRQETAVEYTAIQTGESQQSATQDVQEAQSSSGGVHKSRAQKVRDFFLSVLAAVQKFLSMVLEKLQAARHAVAVGIRRTFNRTQGFFVSRRGGDNLPGLQRPQSTKEKVQSWLERQQMGTFDSQGNMVIPEEDVEMLESSSLGSSDDFPAFQEEILVQVLDQQVRSALYLYHGQSASFPAATPTAPTISAIPTAPTTPTPPESPVNPSPPVSSIVNLSFMEELNARLSERMFRISENED
ncbi:hypothetical protein [Candidatus Chlamydia sanziniae]|uniref:Uncharacterized protein n=1 Tax=Candidatus Chlamydia sanziniae TaxID=1806891 RepID=A0A1A9HTD8_9CHLA|nr:hypothetical protein [Candidatus Chlamydia sanziniae]ANH78258.1 hypothetical protein Cs308_0087 [Candidatus Chlamydia sanziniae]